MNKRINLNINDMSLKTRYLWLLVLLILQIAYIPLNRIIHGGYVLHIPLDDKIPFWPIWVFPYLISLGFWGFCFFWSAWKMEKQRYQAFITGTIITLVTSYFIYIFFPTYVIRPVLEGNGLAIQLMRHIHSNIRVNNAFPSGHTYLTMLILFFWWDWKPRWRWLLMGIAIIIMLSTLFTGEHNLLDPLGGILWAWLGYQLGQKWIGRHRTGNNGEKK